VRGGGPPSRSAIMAMPGEGALTWPVGGLAVWAGRTGPRAEIMVLAGQMMRMRRWLKGFTSKIFQAPEVRCGAVRS
jgi:hypothetical protein